MWGWLKCKSISKVQTIQINETKLIGGIFSISFRVWVATTRKNGISDTPITNLSSFYCRYRELVIYIYPISDKHTDYVFCLII